MVENVNPDEVFQEMAQAGKPVRLMNIYKGLPLSFDAQITGVWDQQLSLIVNKYQATCLEIQRHTFIESPKLPGIISSRVIAVDILQSSAILGMFELTDKQIGHRSMVRVQPDEMVEVTLNFRGRSIRCWLADVSYSGAGVFTGAFFYGRSFFTAGTAVTMQTRLPGAGQPIALKGRLINVTRSDQNTFRLGMVVYPEPDMKIAITDYISRRQAEIQRELRLLYEALVRLHAESKDSD